MHIYLQHTAAGLPAPRFVRLSLFQDLLGTWELTRETGQLGGRSQLRREQFGDRASALAALEKSREQYTRRGFTPAASPPPAG